MLKLIQRYFRLCSLEISYLSYYRDLIQWVILTYLPSEWIKWWIYLAFDSLEGGHSKPSKVLFSFNKRGTSKTMICTPIPTSFLSNRRAYGVANVCHFIMISVRIVFIVVWDRRLFFVYHANIDTDQIQLCLY